MTVGYAKSDLSRIVHLPDFVSGQCYSCSYGFHPTTKPKALRLARAHANATLHSFRLTIEHYQAVEPEIMAQGHPR